MIAYLLLFRLLRKNPQYSMQNLTFAFQPIQLIQKLHYDNEHKTTRNFIKTCLYIIEFI